MATGGADLGARHGRCTCAEQLHVSMTTGTPLHLVVSHTPYRVNAMLIMRVSVRDLVCSDKIDVVKGAIA